MDFYKKKYEMIQDVNKLLDTKTSLEAILSHVQMKYGFTKVIVYRYLKSLQDSGSMAKEGVIFYDGVLSYGNKQI